MIESQLGVLTLLLVAIVYGIRRVENASRAVQKLMREYIDRGAYESRGWRVAAEIAQKRASAAGSAIPGRSDAPGPATRNAHGGAEAKTRAREH
jgi:hypothetical protein